MSKLVERVVTGNLPTFANGSLVEPGSVILVDLEAIEAQDHPHKIEVEGEDGETKTIKVPTNVPNLAEKGEAPEVEYVQPGQPHPGMAAELQDTKARLAELEALVRRLSGGDSAVVEDEPASSALGVSNFDAAGVLASSIADLDFDGYSAEQLEILRGAEEVGANRAGALSKIDAAYAKFDD